MGKPMKKVISYSLWGAKPEYTVGALKNAELAKEIYPDWICRFYAGKNTCIKTILGLCLLDNTEIFIMNEEGDWNGMFWRFSIASDLTVDVAIIRDTDSRLSMREKYAVDEWLDSDKGFHIMRDHPYHQIEICGGMWGIKKGVLPQMHDLIESFEKQNCWQTDQNFLKEKVYHLIKDNTMVHDPYFEKKPFPSERIKGEFVGQQFNADDTIMYPEHLAYDNR